MTAKPMDAAPKDGTPILIQDEQGEYAVVRWQGGDMYPGWTFDGGDRYRPTKWWPLPQE